MANGASSYWIGYADVEVHTYYRWVTGETFFGTHLSTFSMQIHHERRAAGKSWDETSRSVLPGPKLAKMCVYGDRDASAAKATKFIANVDYDNSDECEYW